MRLRFVALVVAAFALMTTAPVFAADDPVLCGPYANAVGAASTNAARLTQLLTHPRAASCPNALALAKKHLRDVAPAPSPDASAPPQMPRTEPKPVVAPPAPAAPAADEVAFRNAQRTNTCESYRGFLSLFANSSYASQARRERDRLCAPPPSPKPQAETIPAPAPTRTARVIEPEMVRVPGGTFVMGSPLSEPGRYADEGPQQSITIAAFEVGKYEVTFDEWDACVAGGGCNGYRPADQGWGRGRRPVINVSWDDAKAYVNWLNGQTGKRYRLLTEAEWEYATRAGTTTPFWWGASITSGQANYDATYTYNGGPKGEYRRQTLPVGSFQANGFGLYDVHGNVWEWVEDCYRDNLSGQTAVAYASGDCSSRVLRGGSWVNYPRNLRSANRNRLTPTSRLSLRGFRLARTVSPSDR